MVLLQRIKDYVPGLSGWRAMLACDLLALGISLIVVVQTTPDWRDGVTWLAVLMGTLSLGIVARGIYSSQFHVAVKGIPVAPNSEVSINDVDPAQDTGEYPLVPKIRKP